MSNDETDDGRTYRVVLNDEEQYSIWPAGKELPAGWYAEGVEGARDTCLAHIGQVWTDMRPKSLRERMAATAATATATAGDAIA
ncbi:MbtH family protein [Nonomuraea sp. NPDC050022]|uniref:MbtH family protein n=1 Tax=unclassified Nonomuraea TaxID=2593643 RepID=UPI0033F068B3